MNHCKRLVALAAFSLLVVAACQSASADPIIVNPPGGPWYEFLFGGPGSFATDGIGAIPSSGGNSIFAPNPPWTFTGPATLLVTDAFQKGDQFEIFDFGGSVGLTSLVAVDNTGALSDPDLTFPDPTWSSGTFVFGPGPHSITIQAEVSPFGGGAGFFQLQAIPEPASLAVWTLIGLVGSVFGLRRWKRRTASAA